MLNLSVNQIINKTEAEDYSFLDTFDLLFNTSFKKDKAFAITLRVHRGGGFTKDHLYLSGLQKVYQ